MNKIIHRANERGFQDHGWLKAAHYFSFANYHDPAKVHFGLLRVLNDDTVAGGMGFGMHAHDNMEIVTIPLKGSLAHKDSLGSEGTISPGEVQIMSAGSGIRHSEFNASATEESSLFQIWVFPKVRNIEPRYDQKAFNPDDWKNKFKLLVSPDEAEGAMWINQDAFFSIAEFDTDSSLRYTIKHPGNGAYVLVVEGNAVVADETLGRRDAVGVFNTEDFSLEVKAGTKVLVIDVPMQ